MTSVSFSHNIILTSAKDATIISALFCFVSLSVNRRIQNYVQGFSGFLVTELGPGNKSFISGMDPDQSSNRDTFRGIVPTL